MWMRWIHSAFVDKCFSLSSLRLFSVEKDERPLDGTELYHKTQLSTESGSYLYCLKEQRINRTQHRSRFSALKAILYLKSYAPSSKLETQARNVNIQREQCFSRPAGKRNIPNTFIICAIPCLSVSGSAGVHFLLAAVPEVEQSVVLVGTEVSEVSEQTVCEPLVPQQARPPGLGQHGVVGPVVSDPLFAPKRPLAVGCGGVSAPALLPAGVLPLGVRQLQEHGAWRKRSTLKPAQKQQLTCL